MKKMTILLVSALMLLTACSAPLIPQQTETEAVTLTETTLTTAAATETTTQPTQTTQAETEPEPEEAARTVRVGNMTLNVSTADWETPEEYAERKAAKGKPLTAADLQTIKGIADEVFIVRDDELVMAISVIDFEGITGWASEEEYQKFADVMDYLQLQEGGVASSRSVITEMGGIKCVETSVYSADNTHSLIYSYLKDDLQYMLLFSGFIRTRQKEPFIKVVESAVFD